MKRRSPKPGAAFGPYDIDEQLAIGATGTIFRAQRRADSRTVALKVLNPEFERHPDILARFLREARAIHRIQHPGIVAISDVGEPSDLPPFLEMEYLRGPTLAEYIDEQGPLPLPLALGLGLQLADALGALHAEGIVHRDLKPQNIVLLSHTPGKLQIKLIDFGAAKFLDTEAGVIRTRTGQRLGTPEYMSPEQIDGQPIDRRADIYSAGILLFEMLTGKPPFASNDTYAVIRMHLDEPPPAPSSRLPRPLPHYVDSLVQQCLTKDPDDRIDSMDELAEMLRYAMNESRNITAQIPALRPPAPAPAWWNGRGRWLVAAMGVAAVIIVTIVLVAT